MVAVRVASCGATAYGDVGNLLVTSRQGEYYFFVNSEFVLSGQQRLREAREGPRVAVDPSS